MQVFPLPLFCSINGQTADYIGGGCTNNNLRLFYFHIFIILIVADFQFIFIVLLAPEEGLFSNQNIEQISLNNFQLCLITLFTFSPLHIFYKLLFIFIVLIQVYNWETRYLSMV